MLSNNNIKATHYLVYGTFEFNAVIRVCTKNPIKALDHLANTVQLLNRINSKTKRVPITLPRALYYQYVTELGITDLDALLEAYNLKLAYF